MTQPALRFACLALTCTALAGPACSDDEPPSATAWFFSADADTNAWSVTVVDPSSSDLVVASFSVDDLAALSGPSGNAQGPSWTDIIPSTDEGRIFATARSVNRVAVFDTAARSFESLVEVGERPVHIYNPNHGSEVWSHADGEGAFYVIDQSSLAVSGPVVAAREDTGHGKLLYASQLGTSYYATNTNDPGIFPIDGAAKTSGDIITLCDQPCEDDPETSADESQMTCGGTHDKGYNPTMNYVFAQCSGAARGNYAFVNASNNEVVNHLVPMSGSVAHTPGYEYILVINAGAESEQIQIWDTGAAGHDGIAFDATVTLGGSPSARGTQFRQNSDGEWEAWIPQNAGSKLGVLNLSTKKLDTVEIGTVTTPSGASHFNRVGALGGGRFFTFNDEGIVIVDLETKEVTQGPAISGSMSRIVFADPAAHE